MPTKTPKKPIEPGMRTVPVTALIDPLWLAALRVYSERERRTVSWLIREAIREKYHFVER